MASLSETNKELQVTTQRLQDINKEVQNLNEKIKNTTNTELVAIYSGSLAKYKREAEELNKKIEELNKAKEKIKKQGQANASLLNNWFDAGKSSSSLKDTNKQLDNVSNKTKSVTDGMNSLSSKINQVSNDIGKINNSKLDNLANKTTSEANGIDKLDSKVNTLYNDIVKVNNATKNTDINGLNVITHESFREEIKKIEELKNKVADAKIDNVDTSKVAELEKEYEAINNSTLQTKMNEATAQNDLKSYIDYAKELKKYINSIIKLMTNTKSGGWERNLSEYFNSNFKIDENGNGTPLKPYGIKVRAATDEDKTLLDNDSRVILKDAIFELDEDKLKEAGDEYASAIKEFIHSLAKFKELSKEMSSTSALNSTSPRRFLTAQGEISDEFKNILGITGKEEAKNFIEDVTTKSVSYTVDGKTINKRIKQMQIPDDPKLNMFDKTNIERLEGFTDEKGEHLGYKGITKELEDVTKRIIESFAKVANFTPGLASLDAIGGINGPYGIGYTGTDLFKRLSYNSWLESNNKDNNFESINSFANNNLDIKNMPITAIKQFDELGRTTEEVKGRLTELGISLPKSNDREYENDALKGKRLGDQDEIDSAGYKISNTEYLDSIAKDEAVKYSANIKDNMKEADKNAAEAAANLKNIVSEQITKTGLLKSIVNDDEERASLQYNFAGGADQSAYATSSTKSGAVIHWGQARDQVKEINNMQEEVELAYKNVEDIFKYGRFNELLKPVDDFNSHKPIEYLNDTLTKMMQSVQSFDKSSYAQSASTPGKDNTVLFDKQKYLDFADKISKMTKALMDNENFQNYGNTPESLSQISQNIDEVTKSVERGRKSDAGNKLNSEYLKNALKESFLTKELEAREENLNSGLLAGADLTNAQKKIEQIKLELNGARQALESINKEAENNSISIEAATNKAEILKETYWDIARALGSTADADKFFSQVKSLSQITKDSLLGIADQFGDKLTDIDMSYIAEQLKKAKNDLGLLTGGGYERSLSSSIRGSKGLSRAEQEPVRYQNEAIREQLNNARVAMTGSYAAVEETSKNIGVEELKTGINKIKESLTNTGNKLNELGESDTADALKSQLINFKDRLGRLQLEFDKVTQGLTESSNIGQLRAVFENSRTLGNSLNTLNAQVELAANNAKQDTVRKLFEETKNYVSTQEALNNEPMSYSDQAAYYEQQLSKFEEGTREYIEVLKLKNQAENKAAEETKKAAEEEEKAHLEALEAAKQRVTGILSTIKSFADGINNAVNKIVQIIRTGISLINKVISGATKFIVTIGHGIRTIITLFGNLGNRVKSSLLGVSEGSEKVNGSFNILKGSATELRSKILLLKGAFDGLFNGELVKKAENLMASVYSLKNIAGSNVTQEVLDWANAMEYAFGISAKELIGDINELTGVLYGLGMSAKDTALGSENILMMSRYLAFMGAAGGDTNAVMQKLVSGMKGMTQAIDDLGLSVRDAQMDAFLKSLKAQGGEFANIATDFSSLNEQARVYVRYASLIDQFTRNYDITNFADALTTITGRMQILRQSVNSLVTTLGTGLTKVLANLATYLIPVIKLIEQLVTKIFAFFGIDVTMTTDINEGTAALSGLGDGLDDTKDKLDKVSDSAKKAGGNLQSFDRINNVTSSKSKSGKGGDDDFDYSKLMSSMLDNLNALASEASVSYSDKLLENFKNKLAEMKQSLIDFAKDITGREDFDLGFNWLRIKDNLKTIFDNIVATIKSWGTFVIEIALKIADDVNIGLVITRLTDLLAKASEVARVLTDVLIPAFRAFYDIALSPIVKYIGEEAVKSIEFMIAELDKWQKWFEDNKDTILQFFTDLAEITNAVWEVLKPFLNVAWDELGNSISKFGEKLRSALDGLISSTNENKPAIIEWIQTELPGTIDNGINKIKEFWDALNGVESDGVQGTLWGEFLQLLVNINHIVQALIPIILELVDAFGEFAKNELLPWINEKLGELGVWLSENKDKLVDFITKIASATWEGFKIFVDLLGKLIDYVVQNPDSVFKFFEALIGLKVASWFTSTAASIGMALMGLKGLTGFVSGAGSTLSGLFGGGAAGGALEAIGGALEAIGGAAGPIALVIAAVVALIAAVKDLWDTSESFRQAIKDIWDNIVEAFDNAKEKISAAFGNIKEAWDNFYQAYENSGLKDIIEALVTLIAEYLGGAISSTIDLIGNMFSATANLLADIINIVSGVIDIFGGLATMIIGAFTLDGDKIKQGWDEIVNGLLEIVQGLLHGIIDIIGGVVGQFIDNGSRLVGGLGQGISDAWQGLIESVRGLIDDFIKAVKDFFGIHSPSKVFAEIGDFLVQGLLQGIQDAWTAFSEAVIGLFEGLIEGIESTFNGIGEFFSKTFTSAKELALNAWSNANEKFTEVKNRVASAFDGLKENVRTTFTTAKDNAISVWNDAKSRFTTVADNIASGLASIKSKARQIFVDVRDSASSILSDIGSQLSNAWDGVKSKVSSGWNYVTGNTKATTGRKITSHAVGGSIAGGQLFIANENGNAELIGNIDGSGKTNVANNNMIMQAMESGIFEAVYNAMAEVMNQRGTVGNSGNTTIKLDGFGLIDASTLRELARILAPYLRSNDINIADTQFSI